MAEHVAEIGVWQAEAARCERLQLGIYDAQLSAELGAIAREYRLKATNRLAELGLIS